MNIQESLHQILASENRQLGELFYPRFLAACPAAVDLFDGTNMKMQGHMLVNALQMVVAMVQHNYPAARSYLKILGHHHFQRNVPPEYYAPFRDAMLATLKEFHAESWDAELEQEWRETCDIAIDAMMQGYTDEPVFY